MNLAGQSNMEGHGEMSPSTTQGTLEYMANTDPAAFGHLKDGGNWVARDDVWYLYYGYMCPATPAMDFNGDCAVGLSDMALLLEKWLVTHLVQ